jgi:putative aldouronate transport system permease protein
LEESVKIDGGSDIIVYLRIVLPLSKPILATVALWSIVGHWNSWFDAMIYIHEPRIRVLQLVLRRVMLESNYNYAGFNTAAIGERQQSLQFTPESIKAAILMVTTIPVLCMYPFLQKYFVKGIMIGSLKG